jgi:amphi-Trp domain-containing protein
MARKRVLLKSKERKDLQSVVAFLRQLADRLEQQEVVFYRGEEEIVVPVADDVVLALKVREKGKKRRMKRKLKLALKWAEGKGKGRGEGVTLG